MTEQAAAVSSYRLLLPPDWRRLPVRTGSDAAVRDLLDELFAGAPRDSAAPFRARLKAGLDAQLAAARAAYGLDLYLPVSPIRGRPAAASFVVSHLPPTGLDDGSRVGGQAATAVLVELLGMDGGAGRDARGVDVAGQPAARTERLVAADPARQRLPGGTPGPDAAADGLLDRATRHVDYAVAVPGAEGWLLLSFSTAVLTAEDNPTPPGRPGPRFDDLLVELFDAIVGTMRWMRT